MKIYFFFIADDRMFDSLLVLLSFWKFFGTFKSFRMVSICVTVLYCNEYSPMRSRKLEIKRLTVVCIDVLVP